MSTLKDVANTISDKAEDLWNFIWPADLANAVQWKKFDKVWAVLDAADLAITVWTAWAWKVATTAAKPLAKKSIKETIKHWDDIIKWAVKYTDDITSKVKQMFWWKNISKEAKDEAILNAKKVTDNNKNINYFQWESINKWNKEIGKMNWDLNITHTPEWTLSWKPTLTRTEAKNKINWLPEEAKWILNKMKQKYWHALKLWKVPVDMLWGAMKKHKIISWITWLIWLSELYNYMTDDEEDKKSPVWTISEWWEIIENDKKNLQSKSKDNLSDKLTIDPKHLSSWMLPYQVIQKTLWVGWNDNRDKIDDVLKTNWIDLDKAWPRWSAERNIALSNLVLQISKDKEAFAELKNSLAPKQEDDWLSVD